MALISSSTAFGSKEDHAVNMIEVDQSLPKLVLQLVYAAGTPAPLVF
jgi:hypothetical protein